MGNENKKVKEKFDALFAEWKKVIQEPKIQLSSRPQDYINNILSSQHFPSLFHPRMPANLHQ